MEHQKKTYHIAATESRSLKGNHPAFLQGISWNRRTMAYPKITPNHHGFCHFSVEWHGFTGPTWAKHVGSLNSVTLTNSGVAFRLTELRGSCPTPRWHWWAWLSRICFHSIQTCAMSKETHFFHLFSHSWHSFEHPNIGHHQTPIFHMFIIVFNYIFGGLPFSHPHQRWIFHTFQSASRPNRVFDMAQTWLSTDPSCRLSNGLDPTTTPGATPQSTWNQILQSDVSLNSFSWGVKLVR